jgi:glycosyltransferase involved in cell wall biosynthesis
MRVLFISSGKSGDVGYVVKNQGESLIRYGTEVEYFIIPPGITGYIRSIPIIKRVVRKGSYDIIHAHYSLSGFAASLAVKSPIVISLMGSDAHLPLIMRIITRALAKFKWRATIVKTEEMKRLLRLKNAWVIPNGVDMERFSPMDMQEAREMLKLDRSRRIVLFISVKNRPEKNLPLAKKAVDSLEDDSVELLHLYEVENSEIPYYLNAADVLLLTSEREGSVNVIKEAMACNCPIVSTDVGDVRWVTAGIEGCYLSGHDYRMIAENLKRALCFRGRTTGRERIFEVGLDAQSVAQKISDIYGAVAAGI